MVTKGQRLHVVKAPDNTWLIKPENSKPIGSAPTQGAAEKAARDILKSSPIGGELITHRPNGPIRSSDTINRADPIPPRDTEH